MKNRNYILWLSCLAVMISAVIISGCKKKFDQPPTEVTEPNIQANLTIKQLKASYVKGRPVELTGDSIITGIVVADDRSGNFYKNIVIQDSTSGLILNLSQSNLFNDYPVGRRVWVKLKGLWMGDYNGQVQVGFTKDVMSNNINDIPQSLIPNYIIKGSIGHFVTPRVVTASQLTSSVRDTLQATLIQLLDYQFATADTAKTFGDVTLSTSTRSFIINNCTGGTSNQLELYNSSYANFANLSVPNGKGPITGIYMPYGTTKEILIRDTSDVPFNNPRCGSAPPPPVTNLITIAALRNMYTGSNIKITAATQITGTVISNPTNVSSGSFIIQDGSNRGVSVYYGGSVSFNVGDSVVLDITGDSLLNYKNSLEVKTGFGASAPSPVAINRPVQPVTLTAAQVASSIATLNSANIEYTLVKIAGATASPAGTYSGSKTLTDASGSLTLFTSSTANFATSTVPSGSQNWVGYGYNFGTTKEFAIRGTSDVTPASTVVTTPAVTTVSASTTGQTTATVVGNLTSTGNAATGTRGIVYSTSANPTTATGTVLNDASWATGNYTINITGLVASTTYHAVAYATNSAGTVYGSDMTFTTNGTTATAPTVTTTGSSSVTQTAASATGNVSADGGSTITERGIVYRTTTGVNLSNGTKVTSAGTTGSFTVALTGLTASTTYYYVAYATNGVGTSYGTEMNFTTLASTGGTTPFTVTYDFAGMTTTSGTTDPTPVPTATGLTFGSFTSSTGTNTSGVGRFSFTGFPIGATTGDDVNFTGAIDLTKYYEVTITPNASVSLNLDSLMFTFQRSGTGVRMGVVRSSLDAYATNLPASIVNGNPNLSVISYGGMSNVIKVLDASTTGNDGSRITFPSTFTNLTSAVTFRFYGFNGESTAGTFSIDNVKFAGATH
jgi:hypothetical protein